MISSDTPGSLKRFCKTPWRFQTTFQTPLKDLRRFVATIVAADKTVESATAIISQIVCEPKNLNALSAEYSLDGQHGRDWSLTANGRIETEELLEAALSDCVDFAFVPVPKPFVIYADHDEYVTFFANKKSNLNLVVKPLLANGFKMVQNYVREL